MSLVLTNGTGWINGFFGPSLVTEYKQYHIIHTISQVIVTTPTSPMNGKSRIQTTYLITRVAIKFPVNISDHTMNWSAILFKSLVCDAPCIFMDSNHKTNTTRAIPRQQLHITKHLDLNPFAINVFTLSQIPRWFWGTAFNRVHCALSFFGTYFKIIRPDSKWFIDAGISLGFPGLTVPMKTCFCFLCGSDTTDSPVTVL